MGDSQITVAVPPGVTVSPTDLTIDEGGSGTYTVELNTQPTSDVTVTVNDPAGKTDVTAESASLTFTTSNWGTSQTVTVSAAEDADASQDTATVTHTMRGGDYESFAAPNVAVAVTDNDTAGVTVSPTSLTVNEGATDTYTVRLNTQPSGDVTVAINSDNTDVTVSTPSLTFTSTTWSATQTITVTAAQDANAAVDMATLTHNPSGADYNSNSVSNATVTDDETAGVTVTPTLLTLNEGGTDTYTVVLDTQPTGTVTIRVADDSAEVTVSSSSLTFTTSNWSTAQTVTVGSIADNVDEETETARVTHVVSGGDYTGLTAGAVTVTVTDDDTRGVTVSESSLSIEEGSTGTYTVALTSAPAGDVMIAVSSDNTDVTVSPSSLTFTAGNWNSARTVTVSSEEDSIDEEDQTASVTHLVSGGDYGAVVAAGVAVTVTDDDTRGLTLSAPSLTVDEGGRGTYTVKLDSQPTAEVTVSISSDIADVTVNPATLTFTTSNWASSQTVTATARQDDIDKDAGVMASLTHMVSGGDYTGLTAAGVTLTVTDNDTRGVTVSQSSLAIEEGSTGTYTVALTSAPTGDVMITVSSNNSSVTLSSTSLTFTTTTWNSAQTVTVSATNDDIDKAAQTVSVTHSVSGGDYGSVSATGVTVTVNDNDARGVRVTPMSLTVNEGGMNTYTVVLDTQPTDPVTVTIADPTANTDVTANPASLRFTASNWDTEQTVTVSAAEDADSTRDTATVRHTVSGGDYGGVTASSVAVTVTDNETPGVTVTPLSLTVGEGGTNTYTVRLNTLPTGNVLVAISSNNTDVTVSPSTLTFTTSDWSIEQTVTGTAG